MGFLEKYVDIINLMKEIGLQTTLSELKIDENGIKTILYVCGSPPIFRSPQRSTRSSSGSAVAVSANLCAVAVGTETWGSIMCPSNANGLVGIKPDEKEGWRKCRRTTAPSCPAAHALKGFKH